MLVLGDAADTVYVAWPDEKVCWLLPLYVYIGGVPLLPPCRSAALVLLCISRVILLPLRLYMSGVLLQPCMYQRCAVAAAMYGRCAGKTLFG